MCSIFRPPPHGDLPINARQLAVEVDPMPKRKTKKVEVGFDVALGDPSSLSILRLFVFEVKRTRALIYRLDKTTRAKFLQSKLNLLHIILAT